MAVSGLPKLADFKKAIADVKAANTKYTTAQNSLKPSQEAIDKARDAKKTAEDKLKSLQSDYDNKSYLNNPTYQSAYDTYKTASEKANSLESYWRSRDWLNSDSGYQSAANAYKTAKDFVDSGKYLQNNSAYQNAVSNFTNAQKKLEEAKNYLSTEDYLNKNSTYQNSLSARQTAEQKFNEARDFYDSGRYYKDNSTYNNNVNTFNEAERKLNDLRNFKDSGRYLEENSTYRNAVNAIESKLNALRDAENKLDNWSGDRSGSAWNSAVSAKVAADNAVSAAYTARDKAAEAASNAADTLIRNQDAAKSAAENNVNKTRESLETAANKARETAENTFNTARETVDKTRDVLRETAEKAVNTAQTTYETVQPAVDKAKEAAYATASTALSTAETNKNIAENKADELAWGNWQTSAKAADTLNTKMSDIAKTYEAAANKVIDTQKAAVDTQNGLMETAQNKYNDTYGQLKPDLEDYNAKLADVSNYAQVFKDNIGDISNTADARAAKTLLDQFNTEIKGSGIPELQEKVAPLFSDIDPTANIPKLNAAFKNVNPDVFSNIDRATGLPILDQAGLDKVLNKYGDNNLNAGQYRDNYNAFGWNSRSDGSSVSRGPAIVGLDMGNIQAGMQSSKGYVKSGTNTEATDADFKKAADTLELDFNSYVKPIKFVPTAGSGITAGVTETANAKNSREYTDPVTGETYLARLDSKGNFTNSLDKTALYNEIADRTKDFYVVSNALESPGANKPAEHAAVLFKADGSGNLVPVMDENGKASASYYKTSTVTHAGWQGQLAELAPLIQMAAFIFAPQLGGMLNSAIGSIQVSAAVAPTAFTMGVPAVTLAQTIGAVGVNMVASAVQNAVTSGLMGGDIGKAALVGAVAPAISGNANQILDRVGISPETINKIAEASNLKPQQVTNIMANSLTTGVTGMVLGDPDALEKAFTSAAGEFVGSQAQNLVYDTLKSADPKVIASTASAAGNISNVATQTLINGGDVNAALINAMPAIIGDAAQAGKTTTVLPGTGQTTSPSDFDVVSGTTDSQRFPLQNDLNTDPDSLSNEARIFYEKAIEQGLNEQDALVIANAMENQKANPYYGVQYGPELAKLSQQTQNKILSVSPSNTKAFTKNFNEAIDQEIALGSKGGLTPNGDGTYSDINEGATYYKDPKTGDWEVNFRIDTGVEGGVGVPGGTGSGSAGVGGGTNTGVGGTGTTTGGTGVVPGGTGTSSGSIINPDGTLTGTGTVNDPKNIQEVFDPYERTRSDAEDYNINVLFSMGTATPGASSTALIGPGSSTNVKDYAKTNPNEFRLFAKDVFVKNNLPQDALSYVDVTLLSPELKNKIANEISAKVAEVKAPTTEPVVDKPVTPPVTTPTVTAPITTPTEDQSGGGGNQGASNSQTATSGGTPGGGTTQDLVKTPDIPLPGGSGSGTSSGVGPATTPSTAPGTTTSGTSAGAGTSSIINPDGTSTAGTQGTGTQGTGTQGTGTEGAGTGTAGTGTGTGTGVGAGTGSGTGAGDGAGTGTGTGTGTGIGTGIGTTTPTPTPETTESKLASASAAPVQPVSGTSSGTDAAGTTNKSTSPPWFDKFLTTSLVPSAYSSLFDPTKATNFVGGDDTTSYLPWNEVMAAQPADNTASPLATLSTSPQQSNTQGALNMPASYYQYGDLSPMDAMPAATQTTTPNTPFTYSGATTTGALSMPQFTMAHGGGVPPTAALFAAKGGNIPHKGSHYVQGDGGGQDDLIDARLADGEYVFDADIVAAIGDGSNAEGARRLDEMRKAIRTHKRGAPNDKIPPKAKSPLAYLRGVK